MSICYMPGAVLGTGMQKWIKLTLVGETYCQTSNRSTLL